MKTTQLLITALMATAMLVPMACDGDDGDTDSSGDNGDGCAAYCVGYVDNCINEFLEDFADNAECEATCADWSDDKRMCLADNIGKDCAKVGPDNPDC